VKNSEVQIMKNHTYKIFLIFIALFVFLNVQQLHAQENNVNLNYIFSKLTSQTDKSTEEINTELIKEISKRKVDFILSSKDEESLKTSGATDLLIGTIDENASEEVKQQIIEKTFDRGCNKNGLTLEQSEQALKLSKQFIRIFSNVPEYEMQVAYLKNAVPRVEKEIAKEKQEQELSKVLSESIVKNSENVSFNDILSKLTFTSRISKSIEQINDELIKEIRKRKVNFVLKVEDEKEIKKAGGNELLIKTIRENLQEGFKEKNSQAKEKPISKEVKENQDLYEKYTSNYRGTIEQKKIAVKAGKEYIEKYGNDERYKSQIEYLKKAVPRLEDFVNCCLPDVEPKDYFEFNKAFKDKNWDKLFEAGASILKREPDFVVSLTLASVGFDNLVKNSKRRYLDETLFYAQKSIELLEKENDPNKYHGVFENKYKTKEFPNGKANALGWMNYMIGYIKYFQLNQKDEAIPYLQKSLQYKSESNELLRRLKLLPETI
jgi:hypothetical protein